RRDVEGFGVQRVAAQLPFGRLKLGEMQVPNRMPSAGKLAAELHRIVMSRVVTYGDTHPKPRRNRVNMTKGPARPDMSSAVANGPSPRRVRAFCRTRGF